MTEIIYCCYNYCTENVRKKNYLSLLLWFFFFFLYVLLYSRFILKTRALITVFKCWSKFSAPVMYHRGLPLSWDTGLLLMEQLQKKPTTVASTFFMSTAFPLQALPVSNLGSLHFLSYSYSSVLTWKNLIKSATQANWVHSCVWNTCTQSQQHS